MPIEIYSGWTRRPTDSMPQQEPYKKYFFICEGSNTETYYIRSLINNKRELNIKSVIEILLLERTGEDKAKSHPKQLLEFAKTQKGSGKKNFDAKRDKFVIVFDADRFEYHDKNYDSIVTDAENSGYILGITNPSFELFLLLHRPNSYIEIIEPLKDEFLKKKNLSGDNHLITKKFSEVFGINPKRSKKVGDLISNLHIAVMQEKNLNQDIHKCKGQLTCNIGQIIQSIINDTYSQ